MKYRMRGGQAIAPWILAAAVAGCGGDGVTPPQAMHGADGQSSLQAHTAGGAARPDKLSAGPMMPDGAKYTIVCAQYGGAGHVAESKAAKDKLIETTGRSDFYVLHDENQSTLYFGYYKSIESDVDPAEAKRADEDQQFVRSIVDSSGHKLFPKSLKEALAVPDPEAPAEYDLARLDHDKSPDDPTRKYWSIAIAAYTVDANPTGVDSGKSRKELAVESVIAARKQGIEAYYFNGENVSTVCVGAWPRDAVAEQQSNEAKSSSDSGQTILVSPAPLPPSLTNQLENSGQDIKVFQPKIDIKDPTLLNTWKNYKVYSVNGIDQINRITDPQTGTSIDRPQQTFLVEIPQLQPSILSNNAPSAGDDSAPPQVFNPLGPSGGGGQLRSVSH